MPMLERIAGNRELKQDLKTALGSGRIAHSILLVGEPGCGAGFAARCLAADYLYPNGGPHAEAVLRGQDTESIVVRGEGASGQIKVEAIRDARQNIQKSALSSDAEGRVLFIYGAQNLNGASANAMLKIMEELCLVLRKKRTTRGAIDFDLPEQKVILDEQGRPVEIVQRIRSIAESIIEEFMLAANETVARHMFNQKWPFIYRVHDLPNEEKMKDLAKLLANFNVKLKVSEETKPGEVQKALAEMAGKPEERLVSTVALRSLKQAVYQTENIGHFGLAAEYYTHFTSPIRRYPDLIVHRLLHEWVSDPAMNAQKSEKLELNLDAIAEHSSIRERAAAEAERATVDLKKAEYMAGHIGEEFDGVISGVTAFGMFIELENGVEGLVHISSLMDDYYEFYEDRYALLGSHTRKVYRLGDPVRIEVLQVNIADRNIDFIMAGENDAVRDRIKAQLLGQRSHASARSAIEKSSSKKQGKSGSRKKPLEKRGKGGVGGNKYVNHAKSKKKGRKKK